MTASDIEVPLMGDGVVFVLHHTNVRADGDEDVKLIGCYGSRETADAAIARLRTKPGFVQSPAGFTIDEYAVDKDHWTDGFVTVWSATGRPG